MVYRIVQELVTNTLKHAAASNISLSLTHDQQALYLVYQDDGKGFPPELWQREDHFGLTSIKSRVSYLNGTMELPPSKGFVVNMQFPL